MIKKLFCGKIGVTRGRCQILKKNIFIESFHNKLYKNSQSLGSYGEKSPRRSRVKRKIN